MSAPLVIDTPALLAGEMQDEHAGARYAIVITPAVRAIAASYVAGRYVVVRDPALFAAASLLEASGCLREVMALRVAGRRSYRLTERGVDLLQTARAT